MSRTSVARYEKSGRLASTWKKLDLQTQMCCLSAERYLPEIIARASLPSYPSSRSFSWMRSKGEYVADLFSGHGGSSKSCPISRLHC